MRLVMDRLVRPSQKPELSEMTAMDGLLYPGHPSLNATSPMMPIAPLSSVLFRAHNQYCRDDWNLYVGAGPRGMGPNNDGCVCELAPDGYGE
jgi:hypothetical protein